jgi:hypothetical protein
MSFTGKIGSARSLFGRLVFGRVESEGEPPAPPLAIDASARPALAMEASTLTLGMTATARPALAMIAEERPL